MKKNTNKLIFESVGHHVQHPYVNLLFIFNNSCSTLDLFGAIPSPPQGGKDSKHS